MVIVFAYTGFLKVISHFSKKNAQKPLFAQGYKIGTLSHISLKGLEKQCQQKNSHLVFLYKSRAVSPPTSKNNLLEPNT